MRALACVFLALLAATHAAQKCIPSPRTAPAHPDSYPAAVDPAASAAFLPGHTRSVVVPGSYALLAPESRVFGGAPPGWQGDVSGAAVVTPGLGAHFSMYVVRGGPRARMEYGGVAGVERLVYILRGGLDVGIAGVNRSLTTGGFVYCAPGDDGVTAIVTGEGAAFVVVDRMYRGVGAPASVVGSERDIDIEIVDGEVFALRRLLDTRDPAFDFNIHIMDFEPGQYLNVKEVHYNQHGLLMLQGQGVYMLGERFFPVAAGDVIYMAPFVPQWYGALGVDRTRYFLYKDTNVDPLLHT